MKTAWKDEETGLFVYKGPEAYHWLRCSFGLPNAYPTKAEEEQFGVMAIVRTKRMMFVDDENNGEPFAIWEP